MSSACRRQRRSRRGRRGGGGSGRAACAVDFEASRCSRHTYSTCEASAGDRRTFSWWIPSPGSTRRMFAVVRGQLVARDRRRPLHLPLMVTDAPAGADRTTSRPDVAAGAAGCSRIGGGADGAGGSRCQAEQGDPYRRARCPASPRRAPRLCRGCGRPGAIGHGRETRAALSDEIPAAKSQQQAHDEPIASGSIEYARAPARRSSSGTAPARRPAPRAAPREESTSAPRTRSPRRPVWQGRGGGRPRFPNPRCALGRAPAHQHEEPDLHRRSAQVSASNSMRPAAASTSTSSYRPASRSLSLREPPRPGASAPSARRLRLARLRSPRVPGASGLARTWGFRGPGRSRDPLSVNGVRAGGGASACEGAPDPRPLRGGCRCQRRARTRRLVLGRCGHLRRFQLVVVAFVGEGGRPAPGRSLDDRRNRRRFTRRLRLLKAPPRDGATLPKRPR